MNLAEEMRKLVARIAWSICPGLGSVAKAINGL